MTERKIKCSVMRDGRLIIVDPGYDCINLIKKVWPDFRVESAPPPRGFVPSFQKARKTYILNFN